MHFIWDEILTYLLPDYMYDVAIRDSNVRKYLQRTTQSNNFWFVTLKCERASISSCIKLYKFGYGPRVQLWNYGDGDDDDDNEKSRAPDSS